jgi:hypothetical protein
MLFKNEDFVQDQMVMPVVVGTSSVQSRVAPPVVGDLDAEVFCVPGAEGFGVAGAKEDAADAGDSGHSVSLS